MIPSTMYTNMIEHFYNSDHGRERKKDEKFKTILGYSKVKANLVYVTLCLKVSVSRVKERPLQASLGYVVEL